MFGGSDINLVVFLLIWLIQLEQVRMWHGMIVIHLLNLNGTKIFTVFVMVCAFWVFCEGNFSNMYVLEILD